MSEQLIKPKFCNHGSKWEGESFWRIGQNQVRILVRSSNTYWTTGKSQVLTLVNGWIDLDTPIPTLVDGGGYSGMNDRAKQDYPRWQTKEFVAAEAELVRRAEALIGTIDMRRT